VNRTARLHALSEELRRAGPRGRTAARLAGWLEVSTRTIKRDVASLQQAGLPVWAQAGPGGGYVLDVAATLPPVNLTPAQAVAVGLAAQADAPYAVDGRAALEKILDVLDPAARERAEQLAGRVWIRTSPAERPAVLTAVEEDSRSAACWCCATGTGWAGRHTGGWSPTCWPVPTMACSGDHPPAGRPRCEPGPRRTAHASSWSPWLPTVGLLFRSPAEPPRWSARRRRRAGPVEDPSVRTRSLVRHLPAVRFASDRSLLVAVERPWAEDEWRVCVVRRAGRPAGAGVV